MQEILIQGKYATAKIYAVNGEHSIDQHAMAQIKMICNDEMSKGATIRVMPDVHAGKVGPIGLSMKLDTSNKRIIPNLLGYDLGCGISICKINPGRRKLTSSDFTKLDKVIFENVPHGVGKVFNDVQQDARNIILNALEKDEKGKAFLYTPVDADKVSKSYGTLGGGNHFIEIDRDDAGDYYIVIHSGSRSLGPVINEYYNKLGQEAIKAKGEDVPYEMTYVEGDNYDKYLADCGFAETFAMKSREKIIKTILKGMKWKAGHETWEAIHNYIDRNFTLHKGSIGLFTDSVGLVDSNSLKNADFFKLIFTTVYIPINMKDGIIRGKIADIDAMKEWNYSMPHGAGRLLKRSDVANSVTVNMFKKEMEGIYSTSISKNTLDESPFAYRRVDEIKEALSGILTDIEVLHPVYNFKAGGKE